MKTKLLFTKQQSLTMFTILVFFLSFNFASAQNLMMNPTCDEHTASTSDNADSYDMTPNNEIKDETNTNVPSPYQAVWDNDDLEDWLETFYLGAAGSLDEQPGSTSSGNNGTRGVKLYDDGSPAITGCSRRLYQKVVGLTIGTQYTFSVDSKSEATGTPSEVYLLNTEITDEVGINANGSSDASVDGYMDITNDFDAWTTNSVTFTATNTFAVVYVRSLNSVDDDTEVFYDNFSFVVDTTAATSEFSAANFNVYPNPANEFITITAKNSNVISSVEMFDILGKQIMKSELNNDKLDVSNLNKGVYIMKINSNDNSSNTLKVIIE